MRMAAYFSEFAIVEIKSLMTPTARKKKDSSLSFLLSFRIRRFPPSFPAQRESGHHTTRFTNEFLIKPYEFNGTQGTKATMDAENLVNPALF